MNSSRLLSYLTPRLVALAVGTLVGGAGLEGGARFLERRAEGLRSAPPENLALMQPNPNGTGSYRLRPNLDITAALKGKAFEIRTNRYGMRWHDVEERKLPRRKRIAFLGDSFTFGCWADRVEDSYVGVFARHLNPRRFEVLNFGVGGYGLEDEELLLRETVVRFSPDYVVVGFFSGNDFRDTYLGLDRTKVVDGMALLDEAIVARRIPAHYRDRAEIVSPLAPDLNPIRRQLTRLATFRLLLPILGWANLDLEFAVSPRFTSFTFWSRVRYPDVARQARDRSLRCLVRMHELVHAHGGKLVVVVIPFREQVYARDPSGYLYDVDFPEAFLEVLTHDHDIPLFDLLPDLRERVKVTNEELYLKGDIHFDNRGHELAGTLLHEWFVGEVLRAAAI